MVGVACIKRSSGAFAEAAAGVSGGELREVLGGREAYGKMRSGEGGR